MNLMSVNIPSVMGESWGKIALIEFARIARGSDELRVLVFLNHDAIASRLAVGQAVRILRYLLDEKFTWLIASEVCFGKRNIRTPTRNVKAVLRTLAVKMGNQLDYHATEELKLKLRKSEAKEIQAEEG